MIMSKQTTEKEMFVGNGLFVLYSVTGNPDINLRQGSKPTINSSPFLKSKASYE